MFGNIVNRMEVVEVDDGGLNQPISVTNHGTVATVGDLIADKAAPRVRAMFGSAVRHTTDHVLSVNKLDSKSLRLVALEVLKRSNPRQRVAAIGLGDYTPEELMTEVERQTVMGARIIEAVRLNGLLVEQAVASGKIRPKEHDHGFRLPDFDF